MTTDKRAKKSKIDVFSKKVAFSTLIFVLLSTFNVFCETPRLPVKKGDSNREKSNISPDSINFLPISEWDEYNDSFFNDTTTLCDSSIIDSVVITPLIDEWVEREVAFNPNPTKAVWLSALFPGLGQIYNRRYWKLPIIVGGYMGLAYATTWNNGMLRDYSNAYSDIMDSDPATNSYMDFFPPTTPESSLDKTWLTKVLKSRKDFYRRNRDLCIISMVGVYLVAMVDAYVDASLTNFDINPDFDISPDLSIDVAPAVFKESHDRLPSVGVQWAINF